MDNELKQYLLTKIYEHALKQDPVLNQQYFRNEPGFDYSITIKTDERLYVIKGDNIDELIVKTDTDIQEIVEELGKTKPIKDLEILIQRADSLKKKSKDD